MPVIWLSYFKESGVLCIVFKFLALLVEYEMFSEEKLSQAGQKTNKVLVKNLFTQTHLTVLYIKKLHK